jgi:hypothetical protein
MERSWAGFSQHEISEIFFDPARTRPSPQNSQVYMAVLVVAGAASSLLIFLIFL